MADDSARERDVLALERAYDDAWTSGDLDRLLRCFTSDAVIISPCGDLMTGATEITEGLRSVTAGPSRKVHSSTIDAVHFVTADVAVVDGHAVLDAGGERAQADRQLLHHFTDIVVKSEMGRGASLTSARTVSSTDPADGVSNLAESFEASQLSGESAVQEHADEEAAAPKDQAGIPITGSAGPALQ